MAKTPLLFLNVFVVATCGLVYELLAGTLASYVLGDSVTQFSLIIGIYLSAMGFGAWLSRYVAGNLAARFIEVELAVAIIGGLSAPVLLFAFARTLWFKVVLYGVVLGIGSLVGLELPLLMRLLKERLEFKDLVARVLTFDYAGALVASILFPIVFVPRLGLVRTSLWFGIANAAVALWGTWLLAEFTGAEAPSAQREAASRRDSESVSSAARRHARRFAGLRLRASLVLVGLGIAVIKADTFTTLAEDQLFADDVVYSKTTPYQRIVVTQNRAGFQLFLNGNLQFSSADEYRYHEALVHPAMALAESHARVLVLGGGDGLAVREVLRHANVGEVVLVDLDPAMTELSRAFPPLAELNGHAFEDRRLKVVNDDAMTWLESAARDNEAFDVALVDFPDPNSFALGKLYTTRFYRLLRRVLTRDAALAVQATSPLFARSSFWCIVKTMEAAGLSARPYHVSVPAFGVWGFVLARVNPFEPPTRVLPGLRFLNDVSLPALFALSADLGPVDVEVNRLDNQMLVRYYESEWRRYE